MSDSGSESDKESVDAVEVEPPKKKTRPPLSDDRRAKLLENLAKGRKTRSENLTKNRLDKEKEQKEIEKQFKCEFCSSQFKYKASCTKHKKVCPSNPDNEGKAPPQTFPLKAEVEKKPLEPPPEPKEEIKEEIKKKKKKKVVYVDDDSSSDEEIVYKKRRSKKNIVYVNNPAPTPPPPPVPTRPQLTEQQKEMILKKRQEEARYIQMGREQETNANRIKKMSANMLRKNRF